MPKPNSLQRAWEQALIDAYYDHRWREVLQPLHDDFQRWASGQLTHDDMNEAIHRTHKKNQQPYTYFARNPRELVQYIRFDEDWFNEWVKDHPSPE